MTGRELLHKSAGALTTAALSLAVVLGVGACAGNDDEPKQNDFQEGIDRTDPTLTDAQRSALIYGDAYGPLCKDEERQLAESQATANVRQAIESNAASRGHLADRLEALTPEQVGDATGLHEQLIAQLRIDQAAWEGALAATDLLERPAGEITIDEFPPEIARPIDESFLVLYDLTAQSGVACFGNTPQGSPRSATEPAPDPADEPAGETDASPAG